MTTPKSAPHEFPLSASRVHDRSAFADSTLPPALAEVAAGRDFITTMEFARTINRATQTIRALLCRAGHVYGIRPVKIGRTPLWPVAAIAGLLAQGAV